MALEFIDSCAHIGTANPTLITRKWTEFLQATIVTSPSRVAGFSIAITGNVNKTLAYKAERFIGAAYYFPGSSSTGIVVSLGSGGKGVAYVKVETDRTVSIYSGDNNLLIWNSGTSHLVLTTDVFHYIEFHCTLSGSTPVVATCDLTIDGQVWTTAQAGNTAYNASQFFSNAATMNQVGFSGANGGSFTSNLCDIYICNADGTDINGHTTTLNTFLGDVTIEANVPITDESTDWTPLTGSSHFAMVDEIPPDDDTSYIYSDTVNNLDDFIFQQLSGFSGTILGAQLLVYAKKDAEGPRTIEGTVGGTTQVNNNGTQQFLYDYYDYFIFPLDSDNGTSWTPAIYNAEKFGVKLSA